MFFRGHSRSSYRLLLLFVGGLGGRPGGGGGSFGDGISSEVWTSYVLGVMVSITGLWVGWVGRAMSAPGDGDSVHHFVGI